MQTVMRVLYLILAILISILIGFIIYLFLRQTSTIKTNSLPNKDLHKISTFSDVPNSNIVVNERSVRDSLDKLDFWNKGAILYKAVSSENKIISIETEAERVRVERLEIYLTAKEQPFMKRVGNEQIGKGEIYSSFGTEYLAGTQTLKVYIQVNPEIINNHSSEELVKLVSIDVLTTFWQLIHSRSEYNQNEREQEIARNEYIKSLQPIDLKLIDISP